MKFPGPSRKSMLTLRERESAGHNASTVVENWDKFPLETKKHREIKLYLHYPQQDVIVDHYFQTEGFAEEFLTKLSDAECLAHFKDFNSNLNSRRNKIAECQRKLHAAYTDFRLKTQARTMDNEDFMRLQPLTEADLIERYEAEANVAIKFGRNDPMSLADTDCDEYQLGWLRTGKGNARTMPLPYGPGGAPQHPAPPCSVYPELHKEPFREGDRVFCLFNREWYPAEVTKVKDDDLYSVEYEDGGFSNDRAGWQLRSAEYVRAQMTVKFVYDAATGDWTKRPFDTDDDIERKPADLFHPKTKIVPHEIANTLESREPLHQDNAGAVAHDFGASGMALNTEQTDFLLSKKNLIAARLARQPIATGLPRIAQRPLPSSNEFLGKIPGNYTLQDDEEIHLETHEDLCFLTTEDILYLNQQIMLDEAYCRTTFTLLDGMNKLRSTFGGSRCVLLISLFCRNGGLIYLEPHIEMSTRGGGDNEGELRRSEQCDSVHMMVNNLFYFSTVGWIDRAELWDGKKRVRENFMQDPVVTNCSKANLDTETEAPEYCWQDFLKQCKQFELRPSFDMLPASDNWRDRRFNLLDRKSAAPVMNLIEVLKGKIIIAENLYVLAKAVALSPQDWELEEQKLREVEFHRMRQYHKAKPGDENYGKLKTEVEIGRAASMEYTGTRLDQFAYELFSVLGCRAHLVYLQKNIGLLRDLYNYSLGTASDKMLLNLVRFILGEKFEFCGVDIPDDYVGVLDEIIPQVVTNRIWTRKKKNDPLVFADKTYGVISKDLKREYGRIVMVESSNFLTSEANTVFKYSQAKKEYGESWFRCEFLVPFCIALVDKIVLRLKKQKTSFLGKHLYPITRIKQWIISNSAPDMIKPELEMFGSKSVYVPHVHKQIFARLHKDALANSEKNRTAELARAAAASAEPEQEEEEEEDGSDTASADSSSESEEEPDAEEENGSDMEYVP